MILCVPSALPLRSLCAPSALPLPLNKYCNNCTHRPLHLTFNAKRSKTVTLDKFIHVWYYFERLAKNKEGGHGNKNHSQIMFLHLFFIERSSWSLYQVFDELSTASSWLWRLLRLPRTTVLWTTLSSHNLNGLSFSLYFCGMSITDNRRPKLKQLEESSIFSLNEQKSFFISYFQVSIAFIVK